MIGPSRKTPWRAALAALALATAAGARGQEFHLFPGLPHGPRGSPFGLAAEAEIEDAARSPPWSQEEESGLQPRIESARETEDAPEPAADPSTGRRCVLLQCVKLPIAPAPKLFTTGVTLWTAAGLFGGLVNGLQSPAHHGFEPFHFLDEGYFETSTYAGGSDKASHLVVSANTAMLLYDAYILNGLTPDQSFALSLGTTVLAGALVELGDGLTQYGFSAQDLTADAVGVLAGALIRRNHLEDLLGLRWGKLPVEIPSQVTAGRSFFGIDYSYEMYTADLKFGGIASRLHSKPGLERFFLFSFVYLTKGYGYNPPVPSRYQEIGFEVGLNIPAILRCVGVNDSTWWGDLLLRGLEFFRVPFTQVGAYYNLTNHKWRGPGAPYHYQ